MDSQGRDKTNPNRGTNFPASVSKDGAAGMEKSDEFKRSGSRLNTSSESPYPSSSSYLTPEEDPMDTRLKDLNGSPLVPEASELGENMTAEQLLARVRELEDILAGKEAALFALTQELDAVREISCIDASIGPLSSGLNFDFKASVAECNRKLQEHASALCQRDEMIKKLAESLKQSVNDREELKREAGRLTEQVHVLQAQLQSVGQQIQLPKTELLEALKEKDIQLQRKVAELSQCKAQSSKEVQFLMSSLEELQQRTVRSSSSSPPLQSRNDQPEEKHLKELRDLRLSHSNEMKCLEEQLTQARTSESVLREKLHIASDQCEKLTLDVSSLKLAYEAQLSVCRDQHQLDESFGAHQESVENYELKEQHSLKDKFQIDQLELNEQRRQVRTLEKEVQSLQSQLLEENHICEKQGDKIQVLLNQVKKYAADLSASYETIKQHKKHIDDIQAKFSKELAHKDESHCSEITLLKKCLVELQEVNSTQLNTYQQDLNTMKQRQIEDLGTMQLSHENELNTCKRDAERLRTDLRDKLNKLSLLEQQLDEEKQWSSTYSQQVQELGGKLNKEEAKNEEYRKKVESLEKQLKEIDHACNLYQPQIDSLRQQLQDECQKSKNLVRQLEDINKELLIEQTRCKSYSHRLQVANTNLKEVQHENSEMKIQTLNLNEQLKLESSHANTYKNDIDALNIQIKNYQLQEKAFENVKNLLEKEKQLAARYKSDVDTLNHLLREEKIKYDQDCQKYSCQLQVKDNLVEQLKQKIDQLETELILFKPQLNDTVEHIGHQNESGGMKPEDGLVAEYKEQIKSLESDLKALSEININLKKEREEVEIELKSLRNHFSSSKGEFEKISLGLKNELAKREEEVLNLQNACEQFAIEKKQIQAYKQQIKELLSVKTLLENELDTVKSNYCSEVGILRDQVSKLEEKLQMSMKTVNDDALEILVRKCQEDVRILLSMCLSKGIPSKGVGLTQDGLPDASLDVNSACSQSLESLKIGEYRSHASQCVPGLLSIEHLLEICETNLKNASTESPSKVLADQLCKSQYTLEKLNFKLEDIMKESHTLKLEKDAMILKNEELDKEVVLLKLKVKSLQDYASRNLKDSNIIMESDVSEPLLKLCDSETLLSPSAVPTKKLHYNNHSSLIEERDALKNTIQHLQMDLVDKDVQFEVKIQNLRRELEEKHKHQMEELRTYFEQKCADFEKHYSEEVFSQHSRKLSDCSSASESELVSEMYYAGPGSTSANGQGAQSHICDSLGECSFKDFEEHVRSVDLEKLFKENREQIEIMRLALESRHQGELEAQKELYEARVEELLRNMSESHVAELKLQSRRLLHLQEVENTLNKKLILAENETSLLKKQLESSGQRTDESAKSETKDNLGNNLMDPECDEFKAQLQHLTEILKQKDSENSAQIATLKTKLRQNQEVMAKLEKDLSDLRSKYEMDTNSLKLSIKEKVNFIEASNLKIQQLSRCLDESKKENRKLELETKHKCTKSMGECERLLHERETELESKMNEMRAKLVAQHEYEIEKRITEHEKVLKEEMNRPIEERKAQLEAEYAEYLEFVKRCADETKLQLVQRHENEIKQIREKHQKEMSEYRDSQNIKVSTVIGTLEEGTAIASLEGDKEMFKTSIQNKISETFKDSSLSSCLQQLLKMSEKLDINQLENLGAIITEVCKEITEQQEKLHQEQEVRLENVQRECEVRFHLQLEEARTDIVQALEHNIQRLLDDNDVDKPVELQELERKFTSKYQQKLSDMQKEHENKMSELCQKHAAQLSQARSEKRNHINPSISCEEVDKLRKERDCLRNVAATLRDVVAELVHYFMSWEDEFNNTLMDELVKLEAARDCDILSISQPEESSFMEPSPNVSPKGSPHSEEDIPVIVATPARGRRISCVKRVHFAPDVSGILSLIGDETLLEGVGLNSSIRDASLNIQEELSRCLSRLRADSAALYALSQPALPSTSFKQQQQQQITENEVSSESANVEELCKENYELRIQLAALHKEQEQTQAELQALHLRLDALQHESNQQTEVVVAEGYGEGDLSVTSIPNSPQATSVKELQRKAHSHLLGVSSSEDVRGVISPNSSQHFPHLVEELCRDWERLAEESRHKQDDLQQQVEAADKQLRALRTFMDEQAAEREQERDDFVQEIKRLQELLRDKDRDRNNQQQISHEVEALEGQLKETQCLHQDTQEKLEKLNAEHKQAVEKIWTLRDIISDLEIQVAAKAEEAATVLAQNEALHQMLEQQGRTQLELAQEMEELQSSGNGKLAEQIARLEEQLRKHQVIAEQFGDPAAIDQMKCQLHDLGVSLEVQTKELECANASTTLPASPCLSSPSEDVSIRETLEAIRAAADEKRASQLGAPPLSLPFNEVSRVLEQWQRHARADDAVLKKIRDLDMQQEDIQAEKSTLSIRLQEQLLLSSSLQAKLDEHRRKADVKLSKATTEMQSQIEDLKSEINYNIETLESRERQIETLKASLHRAETELRRRDTEVRKSTEAERNMAAHLRYQVSKLSADKEKLQAMLSEKDAMHASLPALVESMLVEKNADIDRLERLNQQLAKQMEFSSQYVATPSTTLEFEYCESEKVRAHVELSPVLELRRSINMTSLDESSCTRDSVHPNDSSLLPTAQRISLVRGAIELSDRVTEVSLMPINVEDTLTHSQGSSNNNNDSTEGASDTVSSSMGTSNTLSLSDCEKRLGSLQQELAIKTRTLEEYKQQLKDKSAIILDLETRLADKQTNADSINHLDSTKFERDLQIKDLEIQELRKELQATQGNLADIQTKVLDSQQRSTSPDQSSQSSEMQLQAKDSEIQRLRDEICATQAILGNLQRKVQEAKQIARSPSRSSPENSQAVKAVYNELEAAKAEIVELKELYLSTRANVEREYQQKIAELEVVLDREQESKHSLIETLNKVQQENKTLSSCAEEQLEKAETELKEKENQIEKLQTEINQLNMECVTLKHQMSTPISEATALTSKLDAEKKFALALKEELLLHKRRASSLDEECLTLKDRVQELVRMLDSRCKSGPTPEEVDAFLKEISELKTTVNKLLREQSSCQTQVERLMHENTILKEENFEVCKELSDMKKVIIKMHGKETSRADVQKILQSKINELDQLNIQNNNFSKELSSLRYALKNIDSFTEVSDLKEEDRTVLCKLRSQLHLLSVKGAGDGLWNRLSVSETDVHEILPDKSQLTESESLDDLTGAVQHELNVSVQLDQTLLKTLDPLTSKQSRREGADLKSNETIGKSEGIHKQTFGSGEKEANDKIHHLEVELKKLHKQLETERAQYFNLQQQDCDLIEEMRIKLSDALDGQAALHLQLQSLMTRHQMTDMKNTHESPRLCSPSNEIVEKLQEQLDDTLRELQNVKVQKDAVEKQLRRLQEVEIQRSRRRAVTEEKHRRRIDQLQSLQAETHQECLMLRQELTTVNQKLQLAHEELARVNQKLQLAHEELARDRDAQLKNHTPFVERLKNMNTFLEEHIEENVRMAKQMEDLTEEHQKLRRRIAQLEHQLAEKCSKESLEAANAHFAAEKAEWETEQKLLLLALNEAKQKQILSSEPDVEDRISHLFGRYLRMQSYRKALVWQKRYLLSVIMGMNESKSLTTLHLASFAGNLKPTGEKQRSPRQKFRSAVMVLMAIHRMQFMVERWHRGKRIGCGVVVQQTLSQYTFHQGKHSNFPANIASLSSEEVHIGPSLSPPTLERPSQPCFQPSGSSQFSRLKQYSRGNRSANSLSECVTNFHLVQQRFDALLSHPPK